MKTREKTHINIISMSFSKPNKLLLTIFIFLPLTIISSSFSPMRPQTQRNKILSESASSKINSESSNHGELKKPLNVLYGNYMDNVEGYEDFNDNGSIKERRNMFRFLARRGGFGGISSQDRQKKREFITALALFTSYFSVMGAKCALPSTFALVTADDSGLLLHNLQSTPQLIIAKVLTFSTCAIAVGKFLLGPIVDKYGGIFCLKVAQSALLGMLVLISSTNSFNTFAIALICVDFIFSSCWAASLNAIHQVFPQEKWSSCIGLLAVAARVGNASSFLFFSYLLEFTQQRRTDGGGLVGQSWRNVYWASAAMQIIPLFLLIISKNGENVNKYEIQHELNREEAESLTLQKKNDSQAKESPSIRKSIQTVRDEAKTVAFWMHLLSRSCLMIIASFLLFVPSYMTNAFGLSSADAARVGSIYALGCLLSVSFGSSCFPKLTIKGKVLSTLSLLGLVIGISIAHILHIIGVLNMGSLGGTVSMFLWGIGFAIPFYIPPSLYALKRGGSNSSATIADAMDFIGFLFLAFFNGFVASRQQELLVSWLQPFVIMLGCGVTSLVSLVLAFLYEDDDVGISNIST